MSRITHEQLLEELVLVANRVRLARFLELHPDPVLVAMGVLKIEELRARVGSTVRVSVAQPAEHSPTEVHPLAGKVFIIPRSSRPSGELVVGRESPAEVIVPDETVSSRHCALRWDNDDMTLVDLGSTNGTLVNLKTVRANVPTELFNEDIITLGCHSFQYYLPAPFYHALITLGAPMP